MSLPPCFCSRAGVTPTNTHKHGGPVLEGTGHACVVREASVAVARGQRWIQKGLLSCMVGLGLALLSLSQCGGGCGGCRVTSAKLWDITYEKRSIDSNHCPLSNQEKRQTRLGPVNRSRSGCQLTMES